MPDVIDALSTKRVITTAFVPGVRKTTNLFASWRQVPIEECRYLPQDIRDSIGDRLMRLSLSEIFIFGLMNTVSASTYIQMEGRTRTRATTYTTARQTS